MHHCITLGASAATHLVLVVAGTPRMQVVPLQHWWKFGGSIGDRSGQPLAIQIGLRLQSSFNIACGGYGRWNGSMATAEGTPFVHTCFEVVVT